MSWVDGRLAGRRIMLVAEPGFAASYLAQVLANAGADLMHGADMATALPRLAPGETEAVVLDLAVERCNALRVMQAAAGAELPVVLVADGTTPVPPLFSAAPVLHRPFAAFQVIDQVELLLAAPRAFRRAS